ncbi:MAG TPA: DUF6263 family protein [Phycisphaerales bacterium]|nr:DUF6263 family protein [Phycisphaerales bacterium]
MIRFRSGLPLLALCAVTGAGLAHQPATKTDPKPQPAEQPRAAVGRVDLRPKFELGKVTRYTMKQTSDQVVPNPEDPKDPSKTRLEQTIGLKMTVKGVDKESGEATVEVVYETVRAKLDSPLTSVDFDSTKAPPKGPAPQKPADPFDAIDGMAAEHFKKMVGTTMAMKIAKDGRITSVKGGETLSPSILPGLGVPAGEAMKDLGGLFGPITTNSSTGFDGTARVGEKWTHRDSLNVGPLGDLNLTTQYDLRSHSSNTAKVYFNGRTESHSSTAGSPKPVGVESAEHKGLYSWDTRLGELVRCEMEQKVTLSGSLTGGQPSTAATTLVIERVGKN